MSKRTYDPNLDNVFVKNDGRILWDGDEIGSVTKVEQGLGTPPAWKWRAEVGDAAKPEAWPPYRASYARTRFDAVADVLDGVEAPD